MRNWTNAIKSRNAYQNCGHSDNQAFSEQLSGDRVRAGGDGLWRSFGDDFHRQHPGAFAAIAAPAGKIEGEMPGSEAALAGSPVQDFEQQGRFPRTGNAGDGGECAPRKKTGMSIRLCSLAFRIVIPVPLTGQFGDAALKIGDGELQ